jgi:LysM repeat protein
MAAAAEPAAAESTAPVARTVTDDLPEATEEPDGSTTTTVIPDAGPALNPSAPKSYVVQKGDTLWHLAQMFLKDPWSWPEIWYLNPEVANPHRIYPGDTLRLAAGKDGKTTQVVLNHPAATVGGGTRLTPLLRSSELEAPIATIPYASIQAFLSRPGVLTREQVKAGPYILSLRDKHLIAGAGNDVYVRRLHAGEGDRYSVLHVGDKLRDPDGHKSLGYLAVYAGQVQVSQAGDPARARISESAREILVGDVLVPESGARVSEFLPHRPRVQVNGRIASVLNAVKLAGQYQIVALNRGSDAGIDPGTVLRVNEAAQRVKDRCAHINGDATCTSFRSTLLPAEQSGTILVFRVYKDVSFGLVASETSPIAVGDHVVRP